MLTLYKNCNEIKIRYSRNDNVVVIKRELQKSIYEKEIKIELFDGPNKLDNNDYIPDGKFRLTYVILDDISNDIILTVAPNDFLIPKLLQVDRKENLYNFKEKLRNVFKLENSIAIFSEDGIALDNLKTIEENNLFDDSEIKICLEEDRMLTLSVTDLIPIHEAILINCFIYDTISNLKIKICEKLKMGNEAEIGLFTDLDYLENDKRLIDYSINNGSLICYVALFKNNEVEIKYKKTSGTFAEIYHGTIKSTKKKILLKKYFFKDSNIHHFKPLRNEIITLVKLKNENHSKFVKLETMFELDHNFYIGFELMEGSLNEHIPLQEEDVIKFSIQILEALVCLHQNRIIYRNLKCSSVLLDRNDNVKLCNFHMSKYLMDCNEKTLIEGILGSKPICYNWAAWEMIAGETYGIRADCWSFGATLIEMISGEDPLPNLNPYQVKSTILKDKTIKYERAEHISNQIDDIIQSCLKPKEDRPFANELLELFGNMN